MTSAAQSSAAIRAALDHPIIDADGHLIEFLPGVFDSIAEVGGPRVTERVKAMGGNVLSLGGNVLGGAFGEKPWAQMTPEERRDTRTARLTWWSFPTKNTLDRATATFPALLYERMGELGIDFGVIYPSVGLVFPHMFAEDEEIRRAACRGLNQYHAGTFAEFADRLTPAAVVPLNTPQEGIEELEYAVRTLRLKAIVIPSFVSRPIPKIARDHPQLSSTVRWFDTFGIDSAYDYDPFWAKCVELGVSPTVHSPGFGWEWPARRSISNMLFNHIGMFADAHEAFCKSLFFGGVTRRFPGLKFGLLEGGAAWGVRLYGDLLERWRVRNPRGLQGTDPLNLDQSQFAELMHRYGANMVGARDIGEVMSTLFRSYRPPPDEMDEFALAGIEKPEDIHERFVKPFYFGCEADDPTVGFAFSASNPQGARLHAMLGSDIGHWDVSDMSVVLAEAYEQVEKVGSVPLVSETSHLGTSLASMRPLIRHSLRGQRLKKP